MTKTTPYNFTEEHIQALSQLLAKSKTQNDPAHWLYNQGVRKPLFMLEGITRLLYKTTGNETAEKWNGFFKKLEDIFGEIDNYDAQIKQFAINKAIKKEYVDYYLKKLEKTLNKFNKKLIKKEYYLPHLSDFMEENKITLNKTLVAQFEKQISNDIAEAVKFFNEHKSGFTDFEVQVHELRRKIRWASIYGEAFAGLFVLTEPKKTYKWEKEFITPAVLKSPFSKLPVKKGMGNYIHFNKKAFLAMSFVINELGEIKDKGLAIEALAKAIRKTEDTKVDQVSVAAKLLSIKESEEELLKEAHELLKKYYLTFKIHTELLKS